MELMESRSDARSRFIPARPAQVFAAMQDPTASRGGGAGRLHQHHPPVRL
jgi:pyrimidine deaminase RibD-like protein